MTKLSFKILWFLPLIAILLFFSFQYSISYSQNINSIVFAEDNEEEAEDNEEEIDSEESIGSACDINDPGYTRIKNTLLNAERFTIDDLGCFIGGLVAVLLIAAEVLTVIWIIVSGIQYILALGNPDKMAGAKKSLLCAIIGLVIALSSYAILVFLETIIGKKF